MKKLIAIAVMAMSAMSINAENTIPPMIARVDSVSVLAEGVYNDSNSVQIKACEAVLNACINVGILDDVKSPLDGMSGKEYYEVAKKSKSVAVLVELIHECWLEEIFWDTVMEGDEWFNFVELVAEPKHIVFND